MRKLFTLLIMMCSCMCMNAASYPVYVKGIQVTDANKSNILGDGKVSMVVKDEYYDLYFKGATINAGTDKVVKVEGTCQKGIFCTFSGTNTFTSSSDVFDFRNHSYVIFDNDVNTIAKVNITSNGTNNEDGIYVHSDATHFTIRKNLNVQCFTYGGYGIRSIPPMRIYDSTVFCSNKAKKGGAIYTKVEPELHDVFVDKPYWSVYVPKLYGYVEYEDRNRTDASMTKDISIIPGTDYGVIVCGVPLNSTNYTTIGSVAKSLGKLTSGNVEYVPESSIGSYVMFTDAKGKSNGNYVVSKGDVEVLMKGTNTLEETSGGPAFYSIDGSLSARYYNDNYKSEVTITGKGPLFEAKKNVEFYKITVNGTTDYNNAIICSSNVKVSSSNVKVKAKNSAIEGATSLSVDDSYYLWGEYSTSKKQWVYDGAAYSSAEFMRGYGIKVNGVDINRDNTSVCNGEVKYTASNNKLTIGNYTSSVEGNAFEIYAKNLTIETTGTSSFTSKSGYALYSLNAGNITFTGKGTLKLTSNSSDRRAMNSQGTGYKFVDATLEVTTKYNDAIYSTEAITIEHSTITAKSLDTQAYCMYSFAGFHLKDCEVSYPADYGPVYDGTSHIGQSSKTSTIKITPADYNIYVAGIQVTSKNASKITGSGISGTVSYDRATKTLTLNNATINGGNKKAIGASEYLEINLIGTNTLTSSTTVLDTDNQLRVKSSTNGVLNAKGSIAYNFLLGNNYRHYIENCTVNFSGSDCGMESTSSKSPYAQIEIKNANVKFDVNKYAIRQIEAFQLTNCYFANPANAIYSKTVNDGSIVSNGVVCKSVQIKAGTPVKYGFSVAGTEVTNANANDVLGDGKVSYDNTNKILTLNNANINTSTNGVEVQNLGSNFTILLKGTNKITSTTSNGIYISNTDLTIKSTTNGTLELTSNYEGSNGYSPLMIFGSSSVNIMSCNINTNNKYYGIRVKSPSSGTKISLDNVTVNSYTSFTSTSYGAIDGFREVVLNNSSIKSSNSGIHSLSGAFNLNVKGTNSINSLEGHGIFIEGDKTLTSNIYSNNNGKLNITADSYGHCGIMSETNLTIKDCTNSITAYSTCITGRSSQQSLTIDNAIITSKCTSSSAGIGAIDGIVNLTLKNAYISYPSNAAFSSSLKGVALNGTLCKAVNIETGTNPTAIAPTVSNNEITVENITANSISLSWTAASDNDTPADKLKYFFAYRKAGDVSSSYKQVIGVTSTEITELENNTSYEITLNVYDKDENWCTYKTLVVTTKPDYDLTAPTLPSDASVTVEELTSTTAKISWKPSTDNRTSDENLAYEVEWSDDGTSWRIDDGNKDCTYIFKDLTPGTTYKVHVSVLDEVKNYSSYQELEFTTPAEADGIESILATNPNAKMYNTSGVLVGKNYRGVVIINGKKYMKK